MKGKNTIGRIRGAVFAVAIASAIMVAAGPLPQSGGAFAESAPPAGTEVRAEPPPQIVITPQLAPPKKEEGGGDGIAAYVSALAWPLTLLVLAVVIVCSHRLQTLFGLLPKYITKISGPAGITVELSAEAAQKQRAYFQDSFDELMKNARLQYDQMVRACEVVDALKSVVDKGLPAVLKSVNVAAVEKKKMRATVHVQDIVFEHFLYQLVDYYPRPNGKAGRRFSMRAGIIGRAWRLQLSCGEGRELTKPADMSDAEWKEESERKLVEKWGMFQEEAGQDSKAKPSYLCLMLKEKGAVQGLLYLDSELPDAFGSEAPGTDGKSNLDKVIAGLEEHDTCKHLAHCIANTMRPLRFAGPYLSVEQG